MAKNFPSNATHTTTFPTKYSPSPRKCNWKRSNQIPHLFIMDYQFPRYLLSFIGSIHILTSHDHLSSSTFFCAPHCSSYAHPSCSTYLHNLCSLGFVLPSLLQTTSMVVQKTWPNESLKYNNFVGHGERYKELPNNVSIPLQYTIM